MENTLRTCMERVKSDLRGRLIVPYQVSGVLWMLKRELDPRAPGGLLCDEMGLGKTIQTIATMIGNPKGSTLVVVPKAVLSQWLDAFKRFMGKTPFVVTASQVHSNLVDAKTLSKHPIVLTTFSTFGSHDKEEVVNGRPNPFHETPFDRIVLDEAHTIKNKRSKVHQQIIKVQAQIRWGLTGTPITKNMGDFASLLSFMGLVPTSKHHMMEMRQKYVLRRTKEDLCHISERLRLPPCELRLVTSPFRHEAEQSLYEELKEEGRLRMKALVAEGQEKDNNNFHILEAILRLRQCVVNPSVLREGLHRKECKAAGINGELPEDLEPWEAGNTKLEMLVEEIQKQPKGEKTLIFGHWTLELNAIQEALLKLGLASVRLDGSMGVEERNAAIKTFSTDPNVNFFVIQIDAGGIGLNLQIATRVYINSLHWNAAAELQAIGRAHRTGQSKKVIVSRLVIEDTIDEYMLRTQEGKLKLTAEVLNDPRLCKKLLDDKGKTFALTTKEMYKIFS